MSYLGLPAAIWLACLPACARADDPGASFFENFDTLNLGRWYVSDGWTNGDWMNCKWSRRAISVGDGHLTLRTMRHPRNSDEFLCGEVQSRAAYLHGTFEVRMKTGAGSGLNAAFFTYTGPSQGRPHHEIDVEVLLRDSSQVQFNTYLDGTPGGAATLPLDRASDAEFVHYAFTWRPDGIAWYVDGRKVHETAPTDAIPSEPQKIFASLWSSDTLIDWMGEFDAAILPQATQIDWIAYTRPGEPCRFPASILCMEPDR